MRKVLFLSFIAQLFIYKRSIVAMETNLCHIWKSSGISFPLFCILFKKRNSNNYDISKKKKKNKETKIETIENVVNTSWDKNVKNNESSNDISDTENKSMDNEEQTNEEFMSLNDLYLNKLDIKELQDISFLFPSFKDKILLSKQENDDDDDNYDDNDDENINTDEADTEDDIDYYGDFPSEFKINLENFTRKEKKKNINDEGLIVKVNGKLYNLNDIKVKKTNYEKPTKNDNIYT